MINLMFRACLNFIAKYFYSHFERDFWLRVHRFSELNQENEAKNRLKRASKYSKDKCSPGHNKNFGKI